MDRSCLRLVLGLLALASCWTTACDAGRSRQAFFEQDSAGVTIAQSTAAAWVDGTGWRVASSPSLEIGALDGAPEYELDQVRGAMRLSDGRIVIANGGTSSVRWYDDGGAFLFERGGPGGGPDEFFQVASLLRMRRSSVGVYDNRRGVIAVFDSTGSRSDLDLDNPIATGGSPAPLGDGRLVGWFSSLVPSLLESGAGRDTMALVVLAADSLPPDTLARYPGTYRAIDIKRGPDGQVVSVEIFRPAFPGGSQLAVRGDEILAGSAQAHELDVLATDGTLLRKIRWIGPDLTVTEEVRKAYIEARIAVSRADASNPLASDEAALRASLANLSFPDSRAAYTAIRTDPAGNIWLEQERMPGDETERHVVLDPNGRLLGGVVMPEGLRTVEIGDDYVLGVWRDEFDVERLRVYALERQ